MSTLGVGASGLLISIPSPSRNSLELGPLELRAYGAMIALGVVAAVWMSRRRWQARGNDPEQISRIALWAVPAGLIGARLYHVITDWRRFADDGWLEALAIWEGGLGIPGGMAAGILAGLWMMRRQGMDRGETLAAIVPSLPLAQAVGRLGNWFNQELYGSPTDLPWGLEIEESHRHTGYSDAETFHPTFLYEALWNLALCVVLVMIDRRRRRRRLAAAGLVGDPRRVDRPGSILAFYVLGYGLGRLWIEALRIDTASLLWGLRVNIWMSLVLIVSASLYLIVVRGRPKRSTSRDPLLPI
ncbi:MAG: prolipoprotein diacylglyceryl transferase [Acidimicrobiaceae bacterium]|nr:prolipoprotein diacylglyceryl transferase [Acidimicrobiaceae bacterium]MCY4279315.1 prolipoprotein diacylglyceryl transferase [Acidimicrobiaceae bacterium]MCY4294687.1 prolipoprotein diacylglyceryl transferase [Acidimicrobiaceae bacterium]